MGGERFETTQPEAYLFGENQDLNFLGNKPVPVMSLRTIFLFLLFMISPIVVPLPSSSSKRTNKNIEKFGEYSTRFRPICEVCCQIALPNLAFHQLLWFSCSQSNRRWSHAEQISHNICWVSKPYQVQHWVHLRFRCPMRNHYLLLCQRRDWKQEACVCTKSWDHYVGSALCCVFRYHPRDPSMNSETFRYKRGANQTFNQATHIIDPSLYPEEEVWFPFCVFLPITLWSSIFFSGSIILTKKCSLWPYIVR